MARTKQTARQRGQVLSASTSAGGGKAPRSGISRTKPRATGLGKGKGRRAIERLKTKSRRTRPGIKALREIRKFQKSTELLIRKAPFSRLVREIMQDYNKTIDNIQASALLCLQVGWFFLSIVQFVSFRFLCHVTWDKTGTTVSFCLCHAPTCHIKFI